MLDYAKVFDTGLSYRNFLAKYGTAEQQRRWEGLHAEVRLSDAQRKLLASFKRKMPVIVLAGAWCGDCVNQCPIFDHFAAASNCIDLRFYDRDANPDLAAELSVCGLPDFTIEATRHYLRDGGGGRWRSAAGILSI